MVGLRHATSEDEALGDALTAACFVDDAHHVAQDLEDTCADVAVHLELAEALGGTTISRLSLDLLGARYGEVHRASLDLQLLSVGLEEGYGELCEVARHIVPTQRQDVECDGEALLIDRDGGGTTADVDVGTAEGHLLDRHRGSSLSDRRGEDAQEAQA